ncbi:hypothetical protein V8E55_011285 [Tylopilus felleus]
MSGNQMAHPLLISLANIDPEIHSKDIVLHPLKVAVSISVMMSDLVGNLRYCHTPLVGYIANTPKQSLLACTSMRTSSITTAMHNQFGNNVRHPLHTANQTRNEIHAICLQYPPKDYVKFLKAVKSYGLNSVDLPFWINWPLLSPARFLKPEVLHHFHRFFFNHELQWCIIAVGDTEIDYHFTIIQTLVGYHAFKEGVSKLKQVTRRDHCSMQQYIVGIIAGAVPPQFLTAICALMDFHYLSQMPSFNDHVLQKLEDALQLFHDHKDSVIAAGGRSGHFNIPKLELLQHVIPSICDSVMQWSADATEHAHVTEVKNPAHAGNNQITTPRGLVTLIASTNASVLTLLHGLQLHLALRTSPNMI